MFRFLLFPLTLIYGSVVTIRNLLFDFHILKSHEFKIPVISVGNITVGGTGKTPHVEYLIKLLKDQYKIAVLSRGYKRKSKGFVIADQNPDSKQIGDEPAQIKFKFPEIEMAVEADRFKGIKKLEERKNEIILLDDAFQHRYVKPGLSILLIDFNRRIDKSYILPYGNLRERAAGMSRADIIIVTKTPPEVKPIERRIIFEQIKPYPFQEMYFTYIKYGQMLPVFESKQELPDDFKSLHEVYSIILVTGIAFTDPFIDYLKTVSLNIHHVKFADHASMGAAELTRIKNIYNSIKNDKKIIITTEKDAIKLRENKKVNEILVQNMFYIPIEIGFMEDQNKFNNQILDYVKKNKRNNKVYSKSNPITA